MERDNVQSSQILNEQILVHVVSRIEYICILLILQLIKIVLNFLLFACVLYVGKGEIFYIKVTIF